MGALISHVEHLAETIGPRPATTDAEERAARYVRDVFEARGLDVEMQDFDSPRTYAWAYVIYHVLTIAAAVGSRWSMWPALLVSVAVAIVFWRDLDTHAGLTSLMPKGPSQNVIARHVPRVGRGERVTKVIVVAHYDSARASLAFSPAMAKNFSATFGLMKACTFAVPVLILARLVPWASALEPWAWYATLVPAAYLLVPALINVHRELFMKYTAGANDNASGVAAMMGVMERLVPEPDSGSPVSRVTARPHLEEDVRAADVLPEGSLLSYSPVEAPEPRADSWADDDDISWDTGVVVGQTSMGIDSYAHALRETAQAEASRPDPEAEQAARLFGTGAGSGGPVARRAPEPDDEFDVDLGGGPSWSDGASLSEDTAPFTPVGGTDPSTDNEKPRRHGLFGARKEQAGDRHGVREWLGVGTDFDARKKGRTIGSWDNFSEEDEDESGWKGGAAGTDRVEDLDFAASAAARIRRRVTMNVDRELTEKEIWFVATGAEEVGTFGMQAFLRKYGPDLRDAAIINLDNLGSGSLAYITSEGMAKRYGSDRRMLSAARRAVREADLPVKGQEYRGLSTDATPALARGYHAMSVMAFDVNKRLPNWHWETDTVENVREANIETAVEFVSALIKEL